MIDNALKLAGLEVCRIENERYAAFESSDINIPDKVDTEIKNKIASYRKRKTLRNRVVNIACIAAVVLLISSAVLTVNVEARNKITRLIRRVFGSTVEYVQNPDNTDNSPQLHLSGLDVNWIPEGFELQNANIEGHQICYFYNSTDSGIFIAVTLIKGDTSLQYYSPDGTDVKYEVGEYNGMYYEFIYSNEFSVSNNLLIVNDTDGYFVTIDSPLTRDILFKVYDNLTINF